MSAQNEIARRRVFDQLAAQRQLCDDAARERPNQEYLNNILERAGEFAIVGQLQDSARFSRIFIQETR